MSEKLNVTHFTGKIPPEPKIPDPKPVSFKTLKRAPRRSDIEIKMDILEAVEKPIRITKLSYRCNLLFTNTKKYVNILIKRGLIQASEDTPQSYLITEKGTKVLESYIELAETIKE